MIKIVKAHRNLIPIDEYLHRLYHEERIKQINDLIDNPSNTQGIEQKNIKQYLRIAKRELKKQSIALEQTKRSL